MNFGTNLFGGVKTATNFGLEEEKRASNRQKD